MDSISQAHLQSLNQQLRLIAIAIETGEPWPEIISACKESNPEINQLTDSIQILVSAVAKQTKIYLKSAQ